MKDKKSNIPSLRNGVISASNTSWTSVSSLVLWSRART